MAPAIVTIDPSDDFESAPQQQQNLSQQRTLLLAPPSLASQPAALTSLLSQYDRSVTDLQMLDRLSAGLVTLPSATYDLILLLADSSASLDESLPLLNRSVVGSIAESLKPKGNIQAQDGKDLSGSALSKEAILAGLVSSGKGFEKPDYGADEGTVSLKLGSKKKKSDAGPAVNTVKFNIRGLPQVATLPKVPAGVGFDLGDDLDDDDIIDEDTLMTEDDLKRPINIRMS